MTTEFKVGDRVRRTQGHYASMVAGDEGTVTEVRSDGTGIRIAEYRNGGYGFHDAQYFELVEPAVKVLTVDEKLEAAREFMDKRLGRENDRDWVKDPIAMELSNATGYFVVLTQRQHYSLSDAHTSYAKTRNTDKFNAWFDKHVAPTLTTTKEEIVTDLYDSDGKSITLDAYNPALLPLFTKLAEEAERRGYCQEYDRVAAVAGVPSRAEIKELNKPPVPTHGIEAFNALKIGDEFTVTTESGRTWGNRRFKISDTDYLVVPDSSQDQADVILSSGLKSTDKIEKVTR